MADDPILGSQSLDGNVSSFGSVRDTYSRFNSSSDINDETGVMSISKFLDTIGFMFGLSIPFDNFPAGLAFIIKIINWVLVLVFALAIYRLLNPLA